MSEWINIKDKLPEKHQKVIIADVGHGEIYSVAGAIYINDGYFSVDDSGLEAKNFDGGACIILDMDITHWMPLPKPPEGTQ